MDRLTSWNGRRVPHHISSFSVNDFMIKNLINDQSNGDKAEN